MYNILKVFSKSSIFWLNYTSFGKLIMMQIYEQKMRYATNILKNP